MAASATTSGTAVVDPDSRRVLSPAVLGAAAVMLLEGLKRKWLKN